jgi:hypothetical protein
VRASRKTKHSSAFTPRSKYDFRNPLYNNDYLRKSNIALHLIIKDFSGRFPFRTYNPEIPSFFEATVMQSMAMEPSVAENIETARYILAFTGIMALGISALLLHLGMSIFASLSFSLLIFLLVYLVVNDIFVNSDAFIKELEGENIDIPVRMVGATLNEGARTIKTWWGNL